MTCYVVPAVAFISHSIMRKKNKSIALRSDHKALNLLFAGASIFGLVDHAWNRELFAFGPGIWTDLLLGLTITATIIGVWMIAKNYNAFSIADRHKV